jgi:hypothetical protein
MEVPHVITMKAAGDNKTEFSVTEYGYRNEQVVAISKSGMEQVLDKLAATLTN